MIVPRYHEQLHKATSCCWCIEIPISNTFTPEEFSTRQNQCHSQGIMSRTFMYESYPHVSSIKAQINLRSEVMFKLHVGFVGIKNSARQVPQRVGHNVHFSSSSRCPILLLQETITPCGKHRNASAKPWTNDTDYCCAAADFTGVSSLCQPQGHQHFPPHPPRT